MIYIFLIFILGLIGFSIYSSKYQDPYRHIYFVMGKPGCGKSTYFVNRMLWYTKQNKKILKKGGKPWIIYSDSPVNIPGVRLFNPLDLKDSFPEEKSVLFIDEISLVWDSRKFASFDQGVSEFMKLHRHCKCIIYCASQNFDCDKRIRDLTNHFMIMSNIANVFSLVRPVKVIFPIFTAADSNKGSDITSGYEYNKIWTWRLYFMPKCFKYFDSRSLPDRRPLPYSTVEDNVISDILNVVSPDSGSVPVSLDSHSFLLRQERM